MQCYIYCLYSTEDGEPRCVGRASDKVSYRFKQHITAALEKQSGALYDWMREVWRRGFDVGVHTLQQGISPRDLDFFEKYWLEQFSNLVNVAGTKEPRANSPVGEEVKSALRAQLQITRDG